MLAPSFILQLIIWFYGKPTKCMDENSDNPAADSGIEDFYKFLYQIKFKSSKSSKSSNSKRLPKSIKAR